MKARLLQVILMGTAFSIALSLPATTKDVPNSRFEQFRTLRQRDRTPLKGKMEEVPEFRYALALQMKRKWAESASAYGSYIQKNPNSFEASFNLGLCLEQLGEYADAKKSFLGALKCNKLSKEANRHLAFICFKLKKDEEAEAFAERWLEL